MSICYFTHFLRVRNLSALAEWFYFRVFHEAVVKLLAQKDLEDLLPCLPTWLLGGGSGLLYVEQCTGVLTLGLSARERSLDGSHMPCETYS